MLLTIKTTHQPTTDLGYLLHKHPDKHQVKDLAYGKAHIFYPEANENAFAATLFIEVNSVHLSRRTKHNYANSFRLDHYVNDRPYVASSFLSTALSKIYGSALNGTCKNKPELVHQKMPLETTISVVSCKGGETMIRRFFEPLGYTVSLENMPLDAHFPAWGNSPYFKLTLVNHTTVQALLTHLYVLLPVLDNNKHYFVSDFEVEKLISKGKDWLEQHPEKEVILKRYLKYKKSYINQAMSHFKAAFTGAETATKQEEALEKQISLHSIRHQVVLEELKASGASSVIDLGCGSGQLMKQLIPVGQFKKIAGLEVSHTALEAAKRRLYYEEMSPKMQERVQLFHGALTYRDTRMDGFDAAVLVEVIEHLDVPRLKALERVVFECAQSKTVIITTPNQEYNVLFERLPAGKFRHPDHRFEWTRAEFADWCNQVAKQHDYVVDIKGIGEADSQYGSPSQMAVFVRQASGL